MKKGKGSWDRLSIPSCWHLKSLHMNRLCTSTWKHLHYSQCHSCSPFLQIHVQCTVLIHVNGHAYALVLFIYCINMNYGRTDTLGLVEKAHISAPSLFRCLPISQRLYMYSTCILYRVDCSDTAWIIQLN